MAALRTRPPVGEEDDKVARTYIPVTVEVSQANWRARTPDPQQDQEIGHADAAVGVDVPRAFEDTHGRTGNSDRYTHGSRLLHSVGKIRPRTGP